VEQPSAVETQPVVQGQIVYDDPVTFSQASHRWNKTSRWYDAIKEDMNSMDKNWLIRVA